MSVNSIAARIKLARRMAGLPTQASLLALIPQWKASRLGNYEAGVSSPGADDVKFIAEATGVSPCWLMFGDGPIRPSARDLQAVRHQNLAHLVDEHQGKRGALARLANGAGIAKGTLLEYVDNPFQPIGDRLARRLEHHLGKPREWMDEQHVENDPLCLSFPEDIRELMALYSGLDEAGRALALDTLRTMAGHLAKR